MKKVKIFNAVTPANLEVDIQAWLDATPNIDIKNIVNVTGLSILSTSSTSFTVLIYYTDNTAI